jgi:hypothetical protein
MDDGGCSRFPPGVTKGMLNNEDCEYADFSADLRLGISKHIINAFMGEITLH